jgi:hypothetical protein
VIFGCSLVMSRLSSLVERLAQNDIGDTLSVIDLDQAADNNRPAWKFEEFRIEFRIRVKTIHRYSENKGGDGEIIFISLRHLFDPSPFDL